MEKELIDKNSLLKVLSRRRFLSNAVASTLVGTGAYGLSKLALGYSLTEIENSITKISIYF